ncbi:TPA: hypothetical protein ACJG01_003618 [Salmonella enterica subsp. salamae serovar 21:z10:[z6]]|nr:hypothetical protein [Salmonella enterica]HEC8456635.1 hypothetical protein [Salmonella enterica subsp. enterica serovar Poona]EHK2735932.1 hypothetical protein [Salmonella enterica]EKB5041206.1 hypothetical protein [Salmonella enterica]EME1066893.1 hypothetical protein [Salmonella enterica]
MKTDTAGLTMNQLAERNAEHVATIAALESRCAALSAKLSMINDLMEAAEQANKLAQEATEKLIQERNALAEENAGLKAFKTAVYQQMGACRAALLQANQRDLSQPVDPQVAEYEQIMLQAGWVMVPKTVTPEISLAINKVGQHCTCGNCSQRLWDMLLAAAPKPETGSCTK